MTLETETPSFEEPTISRMHPAELHESETNPREITAEGLEALKFSMTSDPAMLEARPIIATTEGEVIAGNMRLRAALELGWDAVPVYIKQFTSEAQKREWMLRDNNSYGEWVPDELSALVRRHEAEGGELALLGFREQELRDLGSLSEDPDLPEEGDQESDDLPSMLGIVIDCADEGQQSTLLEEFAERGLKCRALMA